jgi:hypothetical protein
MGVELSVVGEALAPRSRADVIADLTDRRPSPSELELLFTGRAHVYERDGRELLVPRMRGGALGSGAVYDRNLPAPGSFVISPERFAVGTSRNEKTYPEVAWPGMQSKCAVRLDKVGVLSRLWIDGRITLAPGAMAPTVRVSYPWNLIQRLKLSANGISNLFYCDGLDLRALMRVRNGFFFDREQVLTLPTGGGATTTTHVMWEIPIAYDESLLGAIFAQTEDNELTVEIETPAAADIFATNPPTVAGGFTITAEYFSLPYEDTREGRRIVIPDLRNLHGVIANDVAVNGVGEHTAPLARSGGVLTRVLQRWDNAYSAQGPGVDDPAAVIANHKFRYGGNVIPTDVSGQLNQFKAQLRYGDHPIPAADLLAGQVHYMVDDYVFANSVRDVIHLLGVTEPQVLNQIAAGTVINAGSSMHTVQESMVAG